MSAEEETALIDRVFYRLLSTDSDEALQALLHKFLAPVILKMASPHKEVQRKVMEVLQHVNKRLRSRPLITLPVPTLFDQYTDPNNPIMVTNFSLVYIKMGYPRMQPTEQVDIIPRVLKIIPEKPKTQQEMFISLILPSMPNIEFPADIATRKKLFGIENHPEVRALLLDYMLTVMKMPYVKYYPPPADTPGFDYILKCSPMFSESTYQKLLSMYEKYPNCDEIEPLKAGIARYLSADIFSVQEVKLHLILASADGRHKVATLGEEGIRRITGEIDWEEPAFIKKLMSLYLGTEIARTPETRRDIVIVAAPTSVKVKILSFLLKSHYAAQLFPQNLQVACDAVVSKDCKVRLQKLGISFIGRMAECAQKHHLKAIAPTLASSIMKAMKKESNYELLALGYPVLGKLVYHEPSLVYDKLDIIEDFFTHQRKEADRTTKGLVRDGMIAAIPSLCKASQQTRDLLEAMLGTSIESRDPVVRKVSVQYAHHIYHTTWLPARYMLLIACSDRLTEIQEEARKLLHTNKQIDVPGAEQSIDPDLYPTFDDMSTFIERKQQERFREAKTFARGAAIMVFQPETLLEMVKYLRTCLAKSCGIKDPNVNSVDDWLEQAPKIAAYSESNVSRRPATNKPPLKQHKSESDEINRSLVYYSELLTQTIQIHASSENVYLLLELVSTHTLLAEPLAKDIEWYKSLVYHHDDQVKKLSSELLAAIVVGADDSAQLLQQYIDSFKPGKMKLELEIGSLYAMGSLISYNNRYRAEHQPAKSTDTWSKLTASVVRIIEPLLHDTPKAAAAMEVLRQINVSGSLCIEYGATDTATEGLTVYKIVQHLCDQAKSSKLDSKQRERVAACLGSMGVGDAHFPFREECLNGLFECSSTKELELHFTVGHALVSAAQGLDCSERRDKWRQSEEDFWSNHVINSEHNTVTYLMHSLLTKYICHVNPHIKQAACVWLLTAIKKCSKFEEVTSRSSDIQAAFMKLLTDNDEITQDIASKGLGLIYDSCGAEQQKRLIGDLVGTLMTGKSAEKKSGEVSGETKLFSEGSLGSTPEGQGMNTYRELCAIATDLNQPDLIYKFLHLASHQSMWNSRKGAAFGFSTIAAQAGEQLTPYMAQIVPRLYRYTFDPNVKIQTAMRGIWNAVVKESKSTVDKYLKEIMEDLLSNLTNNQWRVRESCCLAVNDLIRGRQLDDVIDQLPTLWHMMLKLLDDIKESTRNAATTASKTLSRVSIKICDLSYGKIGEQALSLILPVLLEEGITSTVTEVRALSLDTLVSMSKNAGKFLKPHIHTLVPIMLESLSGLEEQTFNYLALRVDENIQQKLDKARVAASKMSPMMDSINLCIRQVDEEVLPTLIPRLTELIKSSIGLGTKAGIASVLSSLCLHLGLQAMQPFAGKCMTALFNGLSDRNATVRKHYANCLATICKIAKDSSVEKLLQKLHTWYMDKQDENKDEVCGEVLKSMTDLCPDTLDKHKTQVLPLVFLAMHKYSKPSDDGGVRPGATDSVNIWKDIWAEVSIGTDSAVRLYTDEFITITDTALQSSSWTMKAQGAAAMGTIAKSAGENMSIGHLRKLVSTLLSGLSGRTWGGKDALLAAIADVVQTCSASIHSSNISSGDIITSCLREANKDSIRYKIPAVTCLSKVLDSLKADRYKELYSVVLPYLVMDKHEDEEVSAQLLIQMRECGFRALGLGWPSELSTQNDCIVDTTRLLLSRIAQVTWREQLSIWNSLHSIIKRSQLCAIKGTEDSPWSLNAFTDQLIETAILSARESKYSSIREAACNCMELILCSLAECEGIPSITSKGQISQYIADAAQGDSSLEVKKVAEQIQKMLQ